MVLFVYIYKIWRITVARACDCKRWHVVSFKGKSKYSLKEEFIERACVGNARICCNLK